MFSVKNKNYTLGLVFRSSTFTESIYWWINTIGWLNEQNQ